MAAILQVFMGIGVVLAALAVFGTCLVGLVVWLAGSRFARK
jgi:hypothetical protein